MAQPATSSRRLARFVEAGSAPLLLRYGVAAVASIAVTLGLKLLFDPLTGQHPFLLLVGAVMISVWFGNLGPGLLATTALATMVADYLFLPPVGSFTGPTLQAVPLVLFALQGLLISSLLAALHSAKERAQMRAQDVDLWELVQNLGGPPQEHGSKGRFSEMVRERWNHEHPDDKPYTTWNGVKKRYERISERLRLP